MLPFYHALEHAAGKIKGKTGIHFEPLPVFILGVIALFLLLAFLPNLSLYSFSLALFLSPLWLAALMVSTAWFMWVTLVRSQFIAKQQYILLEIKPPQSIERTPLAMEAVLSGLHIDPSESNWYTKFVRGGTRPWYSLEIASVKGQVHFFIWSRAVYRRAIETQIYAQYPGAQVVEAPDYTRMIPADPHYMEMLGCDYKHTQENDAYPIKTYVDYGLDKTQKEHEQIDPLANLVEFMGSFNKHEYFWLQMIIRKHKGEKYNRKDDHGKAVTWRTLGEEAITAIRLKAKFKAKYVDPITGKEIESEGFPYPTKGQQELIAAIERNTAKLAYDVGVRAVYIADKGHFNAAVIASMKVLFGQFNSESYNGITWNTSRGRMRFEDYPWEWNLQHRKDHEMRHFIEAFRRRQYFFPPYPFNDYMVMSTEELASIFHIPSHAIETPGLPRITSATSEAPSNLPT